LYKEHGIDLCYFILATDHEHYVNQARYSAETKDFDFRNGKEYRAGSILKYKTNKPYGTDIQLKQDYKFSWDNISDLYFLKIKL
jgi:hypothetical protein